MAPLSIFRDAARFRDTRPVVIVTAGSSTTEGHNSTRADKSYVHILTGYLQSVYPLSNGELSPRTFVDANVTPPLTRPGVRAVNFGASGSRSDNYLQEADWHKIADMETSMVLHMVGANDYATGITPAAYEANLRFQLNGLRGRTTAPCVQVLIHSYTRGDSAAEAGHVAESDEFKEVLQKLAAESPHDTVFIDLSADYDAVGVPGADPLGLLDTDGIHQTDAGHAFMADLLRDKLGFPSVRQTATEFPPQTFTSDWFSVGETAMLH